MSPTLFFLNNIPFPSQLLYFLFEQSGKPFLSFTDTDKRELLIVPPVSLTGIPIATVVRHNRALPEDGTRLLWHIKCANCYSSGFEISTPGVYGLTDQNPQTWQGFYDPINRRAAFTTGETTGLLPYMMYVYGYQSYLQNPVASQAGTRQAMEQALNVLTHATGFPDLPFAGLVTIEGFLNLIDQVSEINYKPLLHIWQTLAQKSHYIYGESELAIMLHLLKPRHRSLIKDLDLWTTVGNAFGNIHHPTGEYAEKFFQAVAREERNLIRVGIEDARKCFSTPGKVHLNLFNEYCK